MAVHVALVVVDGEHVVVIVAQVLLAKLPDHVIGLLFVHLPRLPADDEVVSLPPQ